MNNQNDLIGIDVSYIPPQQNRIPLGCAIPAATVIDIVTQLIETAPRKHAYLGIDHADSVQPAD